MTMADSADEQSDPAPEEPAVAENESSGNAVEEEASEETSSDEEYPTKKLKKRESILNEDEMDGFGARQFKRMARTAWIHLWTALLVTFVISGLAMTLGGFDPSVDNAGWQTRGTLIADRQTQLMLVEGYSDYLFYGGTAAWNDLLNNVQPGWETDYIGSDAEGEDRRRLTISSGTTRKPKSVERQLPFYFDHRLLQNSGALQGCDLSWYTNWTRLEQETHLWPIWRSESKQDTIMDPDLLRDLCVAELNTQAVLEKNGLCFGCDEGCLPPYSVVLYARLMITDGFDLECDELSKEWAQYQEKVETDWARCAADLKVAYDPNGDFEFPASCPVGFSPTLVEANFDTTMAMMYSSSIFATLEEHVDDMYDIVDSFDRGSSKIYGAYDTQYEDFDQKYADSAVGRDMALACGSAFITTLAMIVHTRSPFITIIGLLQIILTFPLSYFVYTFIGQLEFFPFLNFIGVFVVFALGADNVFVVTDKWKNARITHPSASTQAIAALALPDAATATFLTTITTAIAFFGTAICPVAPIKLFAIFCGLLIMFDYLLCILLVFPALCIYDRRLQAGTSNCCVACHCCHGTEGSSDDDDDENKQSLIRRILLAFHHFLHRFRWIFFAVCAACLGVCIYVATTLELPTSADVRILDEDNEYEQNYAWRKLLLYDVLQKSGGSTVSVGLGLIPADTGNQNDPAEWSQLVLDSSFDPSSAEAQAFLVSFCPSLLEQEWADVPVEGYQCPFETFASWVESEAASDIPDEAYTVNCGGATSIPIPEENFHDCMIAWSQLVEDTRVLSNNGKVKVIYFDFASRVRWDSPFDDLDDEWHRIEDWFLNMTENAPSGVNNAFFSSMDFWWYDTNGQMLSSAYGSAGIALGAAALVILFSSKSFVLTTFAIISIAYVLTAVTATLVAFGWTLGFLESICFAILIGVSVDFVIHFTHSYAHWKGEHSRTERTKHALIQMGPSILAAAFTTIAAAVIMLFTIITFFQKFALILFMTIVQASVGSFVVFLTMAECMGPNHPTETMDYLMGGCKKAEVAEKGNGETAKKANDETQVTAKMRPSFIE